MAVYIVAYDLNNERKGWQNDRAKLLAHIQKTWAWARLSESSYAIQTSAKASVVFTALRGFIDANDDLFVIPLKQQYAGFGPRAVVEWLDQKLEW